MHKRAHIQANLCPQGLSVRLKHHPLQPTIKTLLNIQGGAPHRKIFPLRGKSIITLQGTSTPGDSTRGREGTQTVDCKWVEPSIFIISQGNAHAGDAHNACLKPSWSLPDTALCIGTGEDARHCARWSKCFYTTIIENIRFLDAWEVQHNVLREAATSNSRDDIGQTRDGCSWTCPIARCINE